LFQKISKNRKFHVCRKYIFVNVYEIFGKDLMYFTTEPHLQSLEAMMKTIPRPSKGECPEQKGATMKLKFHTEEHRNRFLSLFKRRRTNPLRSEPEYVAAIYLLSADPELWEKVSEHITDENIDFRNIRLSGLSTNQYAIYKTAKDIFNGNIKLKIYDIKAMVYLSEETINLLLTARKVKECGYGYIEEDKFGMSEFNKH